MLDGTKFLDVDAVVLAEQLTILAADLYGRITSAECETWQSLSNRHGMLEQAPRIDATIRHHNGVKAWVSRIIKEPTDLESQLQVTKHLIAVGDSCCALNNFATLFSISSAMASKQISGLVQRLEPTVRSRWDFLQHLVSPTMGFIRYRQTVRQVQLPCLPCLGSCAH